MKKELKYIIITTLIIIFITGCDEESINLTDKELLVTPPAQEDITSSRFIDLQDNSIADTQTGLIWMKCDWGKAGVDCKAPYYCGFDGTAQDSWGIKTNNNPICNPERNVGKTINVDCTIDSDPTGRKDWKDDSGTAHCANGVLCTDGAFIVVDWREDSLHYEEEYSAFTSSSQSFYEEAPLSAKTRACENHGGISKANWRVPTLEELKSLDDQTTNGLNPEFFPNAAGHYLTSTIDSLESSTHPVKTFTFGPGGGSENSCGASEPLKCVTNGGDISGSGEVFCKKNFPIKIYLREATLIEQFSYSESWIKTDGSNYKEKTITIYEDLFDEYNQRLTFHIYESKITEKPNYEFEFDMGSTTVRENKAHKSWRIDKGENGISCQFHQVQKDGEKIVTSASGQGDLTKTIPTLRFIHQLYESYGSDNFFDPTLLNKAVKIQDGFDCYLSQTYSGTFDCTSKEHCLDSFSYRPKNSYDREFDYYSMLLEVSYDFDDSIFDAPNFCYEELSFIKNPTSAQEKAWGLDYDGVLKRYKAAKSQYKNKFPELHQSILAQYNSFELSWDSLNEDY